MYLSIPFKQFEIDKLSFKKKRKKDKEYIKIVYNLDNVLINDIYIMTPVLKCRSIKKYSNTKIKNKYNIELKCPDNFIEFLLDVEDRIKYYFCNNVNTENNHTSIINNNVININIFKDIYTGFTIYDIASKDKNDLFNIENIKENDNVKLLLAFNYIWINNYNYGLSWRIIGIEYLSTDI
tara:strand:+ start:134 stop:673 length:540 start_codon:yes stop_codon:yes gene_type:complete